MIPGKARSFCRIRPRGDSIQMMSPSSHAVLGGGLGMHLAGRELHEAAQPRDVPVLAQEVERLPVTARHDDRVLLEQLGSGVRALARLPEARQRIVAEILKVLGPELELTGLESGSRRLLSSSRSCTCSTPGPHRSSPRSRRSLKSFHLMPPLRTWWSRAHLRRSRTKPRD